MNVGLSLADMDRLVICLDRLMPHVQRERVAITGGVALQLAMSHLDRNVRPDLADLDLVAASVDAIAPAVVGPFFVSHYHTIRPGVPKFMVQLVDPVSRLRVDVFPDLVGSLAYSHELSVGTHSVRVLSLERIFEHKVLTLSRASRSASIDPKHFRDATMLGEVLGRPVPDVASEALSPDVYGVEADGSCERCELSRHPDWPLAPKDRICDLLGWPRRERTAAFQ